MVDEVPDFLEQLRAAMAAMPDRPLELRNAGDALLDRLMWMRQAGISFKGVRDLYEILGYERIITNRMYRDRYARGGLFGRVIDVFPNATWRGEMEIVEDEDPSTETELEKAWHKLDDEHQIQAKLLRVDKLAGLSSYAVLLLGAQGNWMEELPRGTPDSLLYLTPFPGGGGPGGDNRSSQVAAMDAACSILSFDIDTQSRRYGRPQTYQLRMTSLATPTEGRPVHWSRIIHIAEGLLEDEVYGMPTGERVWNLHDDLDKVTGGGAEAHWLRANQGLHMNIDKDMQLDRAKDQLESLKEQAQAYAHQLTRWIRTRGVDVKTLGSDVASFGPNADAIITQIAGSKGIPKRILTGSEMGELASSQDRDNWKDQVDGRQKGYAGPYIVRPLVDRLIKYGYLPTPAKGPSAYQVKWPHIQTLTAQEKVEGAKGWSAVNQAQGSTVFTDEEIREKWEGMAPLTDEQKAELAKKKAEEPAPAPAFGKFPRAAESLMWERVFGQPKEHAAWLDDADAEMVRVLEAAIKADNTEVIDEIIGVNRSAGGPGSGPHPGSGKKELVPGVKIKKGADFAMDGNYDVTLSNGKTTKIFFDKASSNWYEDKPSKEPHTSHYSKIFGFSKQEILQKLDDHYRTAQEGTHKYATTQVQLPEWFGEFAKTIPDADLANAGRETDYHVTLKYGLTDNDPVAVATALEGQHPFALTFGKTGYFNTPDGDALFVNIVSEDLIRLNEQLTNKLPNVQTQPFYHPHATIAYLKPGRGVLRAGDEMFAGRTFVVDAVTFSSVDGERTEIPLA